MTATRAADPALQARLALVPRGARGTCRALATALDLKDDSHYGTLMIGVTGPKRPIRAAEVHMTRRPRLNLSAGCRY